MNCMTVAPKVPSAAMSRSPFALLLLLLALLGWACSTPCEELAEERCSCKSTTSERDSCERLAADQRSKNPPSDADEKRCEGFLKTCDCRRLDTAEGKRACGLAE